MKSQLKKFAALFLSLCVALSIMTVASFAAAESKSYTFSNYKESAAVTNYTKALDEDISIGLFAGGTSGSGYFNTELRVYQGGNAVITSTKDIKTIVLNAGYKNGSFDVSTSTDGSTWTKVKTGVAYTSSYANVTVTLDTASKFVKLDFASAQCRIKSMTVTFAETTGTTPDGGEGTTPDPTPTPSEPANGTTLTIAEAIALGQTKESNSFTTNKYFVEGKITEVYNTTYGNMKITDDAGNILTIYGTYTYEGGEKVRYDAMTVKPVAGDTVKLEGIIGQYNGNSQMKDGVVVALQQAPKDDDQGGTITPPAGDEDDDQGGATTPALVVIEAPKAGVAYKFGMDQTGAGKMVYINGTMSTYYMATIEDVAEAVDVYVEETTGGFYIYTTVEGAKKYLSIVVSGTHVNAVFSDTADCVFTMDATLKTPVTALNDSFYAFGNYGTYTNLSTADVVKYPNNYFARFYAEAANEEDEENKDDTSSDVDKEEDKEEDKEDEKEEGKVEAPETGDTAPIALALIVMLLAGAAFVASRKRV